MNTCIERVTRKYLDGRLFTSEDVARDLGIDRAHVTPRLYRLTQFHSKNRFIRIMVVERGTTGSGHKFNYYRRIRRCGKML